MPREEKSCDFVPPKIKAAKTAACNFWWRWRQPLSVSLLRLIQPEKALIIKESFPYLAENNGFGKPEKNGSFWYFSVVEWYWNGTSFYPSGIGESLLASLSYNNRRPVLLKAHPSTVTTRQQILSSIRFLLRCLLLIYFTISWNSSIPYKKMPDFFTFIPDNYRNYTDFSRDKADFQHSQTDKIPLDTDGGIRTFTLKSPCPYGENPKTICRPCQVAHSSARLLV